MSDIRPLPIALVALALSGAAATAAPAIATSNVNARRGPGMNFPVVAMIPGGSKVDVRSCNAGWCAVRFGPYAGFVKAGDLEFGK